MARLRHSLPSSRNRTLDVEGPSTQSPALEPRRTHLPGSLSPSASSDKENQTASHTSRGKVNKGKTQMDPPPRPLADQGGSKRRRLAGHFRGSESVTGENEVSDEDGTVDDAQSRYTDAGKYFNPAQDGEERRNVRQNMREHMRKLHDFRDELITDDGERLVIAVKKQNELMTKVVQTADATMDSRFLVSASEIAVKRAKADGDTSAGVSVDDFILRCIQFMRNGGSASQPSPDTPDADGPRNTRRPRTQQRRDSRDAESDGEVEEDANGDALPWHVFGTHACGPCNRRPAVPSFLLGPLSLQKRARQSQPRTQRRTQNAATQQVSRPQELRAEDLQNTQSNSLTALVKMIWERLKDVQTSGEDELDNLFHEDMSEEEKRELCKKFHLRERQDGDGSGVPLYEFIINPRDFGQSVENAFYVSFLIREGRAVAVQDTDGLPILYYVGNTNPDEQRARNVTRKQAIISLDHQTWTQLIDAFDITEPLIQHRDREEQHIGRTGWYS